jgi:hypothetical protein
MENMKAVVLITLILIPVYCRAQERPAELVTDRPDQTE